MKIAICAKGEDLQAETDERFGRCPFFVIVDNESGALVEAVTNQNTQASGGAGPQAAQLLSRKAVDAVILGNVGPNAINALVAAKIKVYGGVEGTVEHTLKRYAAGKLSEISGATVRSHSGGIG